MHNRFEHQIQRGRRITCACIHGECHVTAHFWNLTQTDKLPVDHIRRESHHGKFRTTALDDLEGSVDSLSVGVGVEHVHDELCPLLTNRIAQSVGVVQCLRWVCVEMERRRMEVKQRSIQSRISKIS